MWRDSCGVSKATRLRKSQLTEEVICEWTPSWGKPELQQWNKSTNSNCVGWNIFRALTSPAGARKIRARRGPFVSVFKWMLLDYLVHVPGFSDSSVSLWGSIHPPRREELHFHWPFQSGLQKRIMTTEPALFRPAHQQGETNKQTINSAAGSGLPISNR